MPTLVNDIGRHPSCQYQVPAQAFAKRDVSTANGQLQAYVEVETSYVVLSSLGDIACKQARESAPEAGIPYAVFPSSMYAVSVHIFSHPINQGMKEAS